MAPERAKQHAQQTINGEDGFGDLRLLPLEAPESWGSRRCRSATAKGPLGRRSRLPASIQDSTLSLLALQHNLQAGR